MIIIGFVFDFEDGKAVVLEGPGLEGKYCLRWYSSDSFFVSYRIDGSIFNNQNKYNSIDKFLIVKNEIQINSYIDNSSHFSLASFPSAPTPSCGTPSPG